MQKLSVALVAVVLAAVIGYLVYDPKPAKDAVSWGRRQLGVQKPDFKGQGTPNYMPVAR